MKKAVLAALAAAVALPAAGFSAPAQARPDHRWHGGEQHWDPARHYDHHRHHERRLTRSDYIYRGGDGRYYCRRSDGSTGLVVGAIAGGLLGNAIGHGDTLGTLIGVAGGAALGHQIDRGQLHCD
jgi:hypothetical protein